ncbi:hypothetical protein [uncultured Ruegeria sp.]|uniref:hypothetical protein n=1 Tax=uncultured Ruegeria sp. TaxID=259304 RepID=UPI00262ECA5B|nr:hypothetical protein [uncultured Ruegeria sp.]
MTSAVEESDPVGGYLRDFGTGFDNATDARALDFAQVTPDAARTAYFQRYLDEYYNAAFIYGQGTEHILAQAARHAPGGHWLDIGSGTSALFWATGFRDIESVTCVDLVPEALFVFDRFRASDAVPACYGEALSIAGNSADELARTRAVPWQYMQADVLHPWADHIAQQDYGMITAYAIFGIAPDLEGYKACFRHLAAAARSGRMLLGADWIRSDDFVAYESHDNRYVSVEACRDAATQAGLEVIECDYHAIRGDPLYSGVVAWVMRRK